jgi:hypothetical protein
VPHTRGFPLLGWQLARAESTSRPVFERVQTGQSNPSVVLESSVAQRDEAERFTGFVTQRSLARDAETEQSELGEMLNYAGRALPQRCIAQNGKII